MVSEVTHEAKRQGKVRDKAEYLTRDKEKRFL